MTAAAAPLPALARVREFLGEWCAPEVALDELAMRHVKVRPDGGLRLLYEGPGPDGEVLRLAARRIGAAEGRRLAAEINERCLRQAGAPPAGGFARPAMYAPALGLLFQVFPADRRLESLPVVVDARRMADVLEAALAERTGGARARDVAVRAIRFKPEQKCLVRYEIRWAGGGRRDRPAVVFGRIVTPARFARGRHNLARLSGAGARIGFRLPEPLGAVPELCLELFSSVPGVRLFTVVDRPDFPDLCARVGAALHELHALPVVLDARRDAAAQAADVAARAEEFALLLPGEREHIAALGDALARALRAGGPGPARPIHGDFHGDNVLVAGSRIALVDLEDAAMGEPADDVGSNWAQLTWHALDDGAWGRQARAGRRAFLEAYLERADAATAARITAHAAAHCFLYGYQCLRHPHDADRHRSAQAMLAACAGVLERGLG
jgi:hypothetical protein